MTGRPLFCLQVLKAVALFTIFFEAASLNLKAQHANKLHLPFISAHRGASAVAPENTLSSFSKAIELGVDFIEIDVRTTSDGEQVIVHDQSLKRTTGLDANVNETGLTKIRTLSAGRWFGEQFATEKVPTLEDVCQLVNSENEQRNHMVNLYVDCKAIDVIKVVQLLKKYDLIDSAVFYGDIKTLTDVRKNFSFARLMPSFPGTKDAAVTIEKLNPYAFDIPYGQLNETTIAYIHGKGIKVFSDLLGKNDTPYAYRRAVNMGVDLIQTDHVSTVLNVYKEFESKNK